MIKCHLTQTVGASYQLAQQTDCFGCTELSAHESQLDSHSLSFCFQTTFGNPLHNSEPKPCARNDCHIKFKVTQDEHDLQYHDTKNCALICECGYTAISVQTFQTHLRKAHRLELDRNQIVLTFLFETPNFVTLTRCKGKVENDKCYFQSLYPTIVQNLHECEKDMKGHPIQLSEVFPPFYDAIRNNVKPVRGPPRIRNPDFVGNIPAVSWVEMRNSDYLTKSRHESGIQICEEHDQKYRDAYARVRVEVDKQTRLAFPKAPTESKKSKSVPAYSTMAKHPTRSPSEYQGNLETFKIPSLSRLTTTPSNPTDKTLKPDSELTPREEDELLDLPSDQAGNSARAGNSAQVALIDRRNAVSIADPMPAELQTPAELAELAQQDKEAAHELMGLNPEESEMDTSEATLKPERKTSRTSSQAGFGDNSNPDEPPTKKKKKQKGKKKSNSANRKLAESKKLSTQSTPVVVVRAPAAVPVKGKTDFVPNWDKVNRLKLPNTAPYEASKPEEVRTIEKCPVDVLMSGTLNVSKCMRPHMACKVHLTCEPKCGQYVVIGRDGDPLALATVTFSDKNPYAYGSYWNQFNPLMFPTYTELANFNCRPTQITHVLCFSKVLPPDEYRLVLTPVQEGAEEAYPCFIVELDIDFGQPRTLTYKDS